MSKDKIKFQTQIKGKDMGIFNIYCMYRRFSGIFSLLMGLVALALSVSTFLDKNVQNGVIFFLIGAMFLGYFPWILMKRGSRSVAKNPTFSKPLFYTLDESGVAIDQLKEHAKVAWEDCFKAVEISKAIYLFTSPKSAFIWPKDQLGSDQEIIKKILKENLAPTKCKSIKVK